MRRAIFAVLFLGIVAPAGAAPEEVSIQELKNLSQERCLALPPAEIVTRCPSLAGRLLEVDHAQVALVDHDQKKGTQLCEENGGTWHCRRIVVLEYELRGTRKRDPQKFITVAELLRRLATAPSVKLGDDFGALQAPGLPPRTCLDVNARGCAVLAVRLRAHAPDKAGAPSVRRRMWVVEDADGPTLMCSDAELTRCDQLNAASWSALALTLRPSSLAAPQLPPEVDAPETRSDRRPGWQAAGGDGAETPSGAVDSWIRPKAAQALPKTPQRADVAKAAHALETAGRGCVAAETAAVAVGVIFSGEGSLLSLNLTSAAPSDPQVQACLTAAAKKLAFPRFDGNSYTMQALVLPPIRGARRRTSTGRSQR